MRIGSGLGIAAVTALGLSLTATPSAVAESWDLSGDGGVVYQWPEFQTESDLVDDMTSLAALVEELAPQAGVAAGVADELAYRMRQDPVGVMDEWYGNEPAAEAGQLVAESESVAVTITVLEDGNLGLGMVQLAPATSDNGVVDIGGVRVDFFPLLHAVTAELVANASPAERSSMPDVTARGVSGCTALPNSGGWVRRADCTVYGSRTPPTSSASILVSYSVKSGGGRIDGTPSQLATRCAVGAPANKSLTIIRRLNSGSVPARVDYTFDCVRGGGSLGTPARLSFYAYGSAWEDFH